MFDDLIPFAIIALAAAAWRKAIITTRKYPERFNKPQATWQIAADMAQEKSCKRDQLSQAAPDKPATISPISFW